MKWEHTIAGLRQTAYTTHGAKVKSLLLLLVHIMARLSSWGVWRVLPLQVCFTGGPGLPFLQTPNLLGLADIVSGPFWVLVLRINQSKSLAHLLGVLFSLGAISTAPDAWVDPLTAGEQGLGVIRKNSR